MSANFTYNEGIYLEALKAQQLFNCKVQRKDANSQIKYESFGA